LNQRTSPSTTLAVRARLNREIGSAVDIHIPIRSQEALSVIRWASCFCLVMLRILGQPLVSAPMAHRNQKRNRIARTPTKAERGDSMAGMVLILLSLTRYNGRMNSLHSVLFLSLVFIGSALCSASTSWAQPVATKVEVSGSTMGGIPYRAVVVCDPDEAEAAALKSAVVDSLARVNNLMSTYKPSGCRNGNGGYPSD